MYSGAGAVFANEGKEKTQTTEQAHEHSVNK